MSAGRDAWPDEKLAALCERWRAGETTAAIGAAMGITKNTVTGKVNRLVKRGILEGRPSPLGANKGQGRPRERRAVSAPVATLPAPPPIRQPPPPPLPPPPPPPAASAASATCRWPMWSDTERPTHRYCSAPVPLGASWCQSHRAIIFHRVRAA